ncbi:MAG: hypothetical protein RR540_08340 [Oscillospiraceae bacterium]
MNENVEVFDQQDVTENKVIAVLACVPILFWLPFVSCPNSPLAKHYANQSLVLLIAEVILTLASSILGIIPAVGAIMTVCTGVISLLLFVCMIILMVGAYQGKASKIPAIGGITIIK